MPIEKVNKIEQSELLQPEMQQEQIASGNASPPNEQLPSEEVIGSYKKGDTAMWKGKIGKIINIYGSE